LPFPVAEWGDIAAAGVHACGGAAFRFFFGVRPMIAGGMK
jgi:hypothetical protein